MDIIPVIDVLGGVAVAAKRGDRANYKPLSTPLASGSDPVDIAKGYLELFPFKTLYVADLDAISGGKGNGHVIERLSSALPQLHLWVDSGVSSLEAAKDLFAQPQISIVVGSESVRKLKECEALFRLASHHAVLSLDLDNEGFIGPHELLTSPQIWPLCVIAMSLANVGCGGGAHLDYIKDVCTMAGPNRRVYAAGGVRDLKDIEAVHQAGARGALISTALHGVKIKAGDLSKIAGL